MACPLEAGASPAWPVVEDARSRRRGPSRGGLYDLDLDLVHGEQFGRADDRGAQDAVEVDGVELVGGTRESLPRLPFGAGADPHRGRQMHPVHQNRQAQQKQVAFEQDEVHRDGRGQPARA